MPMFMRIFKLTCLVVLVYSSGVPRKAHQVFMCIFFVCLPLDLKITFFASVVIHVHKRMN